MKKRIYRRTARGFTLIEILVVIGMLAILSTVVLVAVNPLRQFAQARTAERVNDVQALLNAAGERLADNGGLWIAPDSHDGCTTGLPTTPTVMGNAHPDDLDIRSCLVTEYLPEIPRDPATGSNTCTSATCSGSDEHYYSSYTIMQDPDTNRITVCAPTLESALNQNKPYCLTR